MLTLLPTFIGILVYSNHVTPYPLYLPGQGSLAFHDPLHDKGSSSGWEEYTNTDGSGCKFTGGAYNANAVDGYYTPCYATATDFGNFAIEADMKITAGAGCGGIIFRADEKTDQLYFFRVCQDGTEGLIKYVDNTAGDATHLMDADNSSVVNTGVGQPNQLAVLAEGAAITLYVNGQPIGSVSDDTYARGQIALFADASNGSTEVVFSNVNIWDL